jgi:hypothetical protein
MTTHLWRADGTYFGYRDGADLWTRDGVLAGHFHEDEIYDAHGHYLGEIAHDERLVSATAKEGHHQAPFAPRKGASSSHGSLAGRGPGGGFKEFPDPHNFK